jgi:hypothetical protein
VLEKPAFKVREYDENTPLNPHKISIFEPNNNVKNVEKNSEKWYT